MLNKIEQEPQRQSWGKRWLKDEDFWQGIVIQTLGTLVATIIIALVLVFTGIGYTPAIRYYVIFGLVILIVILIYLFSWAFSIGFAIKKVVESRQSWRHSIWLLAGKWALVSTLMVFAVNALLITAVYFIQDIIAIWTGYTP